MSEFSSLHVPSLERTGDLRDPVLSDEKEALPVRWTEELLTGLDWRKVVEIARALAASSGWEPGGTRIGPDGMAEFTMTLGSGAQKRRSVVRVAPWNRWMASGECMARFASDLVALKGASGVYLAPGGASPSAKIEASRLGIELVDAEALADSLNGLPATHSEYFHDVTMSGQPFVPTCPVCLRPLSQSAETNAAIATERKPRDLCYATSDIVAEPVVARRIEILRNCEVHFLREVRARDMCVEGVVFGDLVCEGSLLLNPGAVVNGNVAARSVLVRPGAELRGETRILQGSLGTAEKSPTSLAWVCEQLPKKAGCERVHFALH